jgi:hypothetical protein
MFAEQGYGELLGPGGSSLFFGVEIDADGKTANIGKMLLEFVFHLAFHLRFPYLARPALIVAC